MDDWKNWEGRIIDQRFRLLQNISAGQHKAVFLTEFNEHKAAIKLVPADSRTRQEWDQSTTLDHANLLRIFHTGADSDVLYAVMEYADDDLSKVLPERALTEQEVRDMLPPVLSALEYLHRRGLVHGHLKPSNIMAAGDQVKVAADGLSRAGQHSASPQSPYDAPEIAATGYTPASDVWSFGVILAEALTQQATSQPDFARLPARLAEIVRLCLDPDPMVRPSAADIDARFRGVTPPAPKPAASPVDDRARVAASRRNVALLTGAALVMGTILFGPRLIDSSPPAAEPIVVPPPPQPPAAQPPPPQIADTAGQVVDRVLPDVNAKARRSVRGRIRVTVRVDVDESGSVTKAALVSRGPSRYFADLAVKAARRWKFKPPVVGGRNSASQWNLLFEFTRSETKVTPRQARA